MTGQTAPRQAKAATAGALDHAFASPSLLAAAAAGRGPPRVVDWRCGDGTVVSDHLGLRLALARPTAAAPPAAPPTPALSAAAASPH